MYKVSYLYFFLIIFLNLFFFFIVYKDHSMNFATFIFFNYNMHIPTERNTSLKTIEKLTKYKDLEIEIEKTWGMKTITVPVIIGAFLLLFFIFIFFLFLIFYLFIYFILFYFILFYFVFHS